MTLNAAPEAPGVREAEDDELRDALIREARRRARRRRLLYGGVAAGMVLTVAGVGIVAGPTSPTPPPVDSSFVTVDDLLPPAQAVPSSPETGELVASVSKVHEGAWYLYADGRLISIDNTRHQTGWVEQRLTPAGVERIRAEFLASGMFDLGQQPTEPPPNVNPPPFGVEAPFGYPRVRDGGKLLVGRPGTETSPAGQPGRDLGDEVVENFVVAHGPSCVAQGGAKCDLITYLRGLGSSLPQNEWVLQEPTHYVPAKYGVCFIPVKVSPGSIIALGFDEVDSSGQLYGASLADLHARVAMMPSPVAGLLGGREPTHGSCFDVARADMRVVVAALTEEINAWLETAGTDIYGNEALTAKGATSGAGFSALVEPASTSLDLWAYLPGGGVALWGS